MVVVPLKRTDQRMSCNSLGGPIEERKTIFERKPGKEAAEGIGVANPLHVYTSRWNNWNAHPSKRQLYIDFVTYAKLVAIRVLGNSSCDKCECAIRGFEPSTLRKVI